MFILSREHLIDTNIEKSVSTMQNIIEMGRVMRDRKTIPVKVSVNSFIFKIFTMLSIFFNYLLLYKSFNFY